ncbi:MAG: hypothetical protein EDR02_17550 [Actinobacteria bacterium]|nr:MAG: hypothetical protein EDR02_17550 [Actinomycetota bacterium]RIK04124.1 MAG: hypothetical protein DCC48_14505 [Acidobacteriota bacterium]
MLKSAATGVDAMAMIRRVEGSDEATLSTRCPHCGIVEVPTLAVTVWHPHGEEGGRYSFICPRCGAVKNKAIDADTAGILWAAGASRADDG